MTRIKLHDGSFNDWDALQGLLHEAFAYMENRIDPPSSLHKMTAADLRQKAETETLLLAFDEDKLVGCCFLADEGETLYLGKLAVSAALQSSGVGTALMAFAGDYGRRQGKSAIELQSRIELTEVHAFFRKFGFRKTSTTAHEGYVRPTSLTMALELS